MKDLQFDIQSFAEIINDNYESLVAGTSDADEIYNFGNYVLIDSGAGNDTILNFGNGSSRYSSMSSSYYENYVSIDGGAGSDEIYNSGSYVQIDGGAGNDVVSLSSDSYKNLIQYKNGDGNDTVYGIKEDDTLQISGTEYTTVKSGNDIIFNVGSGKITVKDGANNNFNIDGEVSVTGEYISNYRNNSLVSGTARNDSIFNEGNNVTIQGNAGDDTIQNYNYNYNSYGSSVSSSYYGMYVSIDAGAGDDFINNSHLPGNSLSSSYYGNYVTINGGDGNDTVKSISANSKIYGGNGDDSVYNSGDNVTIEGGAGNDTIANYDNNVSINGGAGNDYIHNIDGNYVSMNGGADNDYIYNYRGNYVSMNGGADNDYIYNSGNNNSINGGAGNDTIAQYGYSFSYSLSSYYYGYNNTIAGGAGDDVVSLSGDSKYNLIQYKNGDGNDTVYGLNESDTLQISGAKYTTVKSGNDIIFNVGSGKITVKDGANNNFNIDEEASVSGAYISNYRNNSLVSGTARNDSIFNEGNNVTIQGNAGDDTIQNYNYNYNSYGSSVSSSYYGMYVSIDAGAGDDFINNSHLTGNSISSSYYGNYVTINGGDGNDTVKSISANSKIYGGNGDDSVYSIGDNVTIEGGTGNDIIANYGENTTINGGAGNDIIYNSRDYVQIDGGAGNDIICNSGDYVQIDGGADNDDIYNEGNDDSINGGAGNDTIMQYGYRYSYSLSSYYYGYNNTIAGGAGDDVVSLSGDSKYNLIQYNNGDGNDTVYGLNEDDTLQISGAKYTTVKRGNDIIFNVGSGKITVKDAANVAVNIDGTLDSGSSQDTTPAEDLPVGITVKKDVLTASNKFKGTEINLADYPNVTKINAAALSQAVNIVGNENNDSIKGGKGADTISGGSGKNTLTGGAGTDIFVYDGGNDLITDYKVGEDKINLNLADVTKSSVKGSDVILTTDEGTLKIKGVKDKVVTFIDASGATTDKIFFADTYYTPLEDGLKYDAKRTVLTVSNKFTGTEIDLGEYVSSVTKVNASSAKQALNIVGNDNNNSIKGSKFADTISGGNGKNTLTGGAGNDLIIGGTGDDKILGEAGNDTLNGGKGKNTLTGGAGADTFVYDGGNDLITDYKVGEDRISLNLADVTGSSVKGSDVILTTDEGTLTIKGAKDKVVTFIDESGLTTDRIFFADTSYSPLEDGLKYDAKRTVLTASNKFKGTEIDLGEYVSSVTKVNASAVSQGVNIVGNSNNNSIKSGKGADTISGGSGNDTLTGGAGKDVFVYTGGNDLITDYKLGEDKIEIEGKISNTSYKGKDIIFTVGDGTLTVKGMKDKEIPVTDSSGTQFYSKTFDLIHDNNFVADEFGIDSITEKKFAVTQIETADTSKEFNAETLITYSENK